MRSISKYSVNYGLYICHELSMQYFKSLAITTNQVFSKSQAYLWLLANHLGLPLLVQAK